MALEARRQVRTLLRQALQVQLGLAGAVEEPGRPALGVHSLGRLRQPCRVCALLALQLGVDRLETSVDRLIV